MGLVERVEVRSSGRTTVAEVPSLAINKRRLKRHILSTGFSPEDSLDMEPSKGAGVKVRQVPGDSHRSGRSGLLEGDGATCHCTLQHNDGLHERHG